jgi:hypothetical protein
LDLAIKLEFTLMTKRSTWPEDRPAQTMTDDRIDAFRMMTTANGCTPAEAALAHRHLITALTDRVKMATTESERLKAEGELAEARLPEHERAARTRIRRDLAEAATRAERAHAQAERGQAEARTRAEWEQDAQDEWDSEAYGGSEPEDEWADGAASDWEPEDEWNSDAYTPQESERTTEVEQLSAWDYLMTILSLMGLYFSCKFSYAMIYAGWQSMHGTLR